MADRRFHGKRVSYTWYRTMAAYEAETGDYLVVNSGRRTLSEQWYLYRNQPPLAAYPSPTAPHIRVGREDHAVDINCIDGDAERFRRWCARHGIILRYTVRGECWHLEVMNRKEWPHLIPGTRPTLKPGDYNRAVQTVKYQLIRRGYQKRFPFAYRTVFDKRKYTRGNFERAVRQFQRDRGIPATGTIGPLTWRALLAGTGIKP